LGAGRGWPADESDNRGPAALGVDHAAAEAAEAASVVGPAELRLGVGDGGVDRSYVAAWRNLPNPNKWQVTPETARLIDHWRHHRFGDIRPFFCQIGAVETAIWLAEVASDRAAAGAKIWTHIRGANKESNRDLLRIALKLATGAGKTTVIAMLTAASRSRTDRLRVLQPNDPNSYFRERELVPNDMLGDIERAKIVITNYHAFRRRERIEVSKTGRALFQGRGPELNTLETEGQMLQRACGDLMSLNKIVVLNDEAHHCYREKP
jgi:type III restriction enzyme